jgi:hypothetical protein
VGGTARLRKSLVGPWLGRGVTASVAGGGGGGGRWREGEQGIPPLEAEMAGGTGARAGGAGKKKDRRQGSELVGHLWASRFR